MKNGILSLANTLPANQRISFINTDLNEDMYGDSVLSMDRSKFVTTLSKMELSNTTEAASPIGVLQILIEQYEPFLAYCPSEARTSDSSEYDDNYLRKSSYYGYGSYSNYGTSFDDVDSNESNMVLCEDPEGAQFNQDIELGHARLVDKATSKTIFIIDFTPFESINQDDIEISYQNLTNLFKSWIVYFLNFLS